MANGCLEFIQHILKYIKYIQKKDAFTVIYIYYFSRFVIYCHISTVKLLSEYLTSKYLPMKKINFLFLVAAMSVQGFAQQYMYTGATEIANTIPFASTASNFRQSIYYPSDFPTAPAGNIVAIYLKASTAASPNITNLKVKMGTTTMTIFPNSTFITGLQTVYSGNYNTPVVSGNYIKIPLQTPFPYDPTQNLMVELSQESYSPGFQIMQGSINVNSRTVFGNMNNATGTVQHRLATMGFDMDNAMATTEVGAENGLKIYPNPVTDVLHITKVSADAAYSVHDPAGRLIKKGEVSKRGTVDVSELSAGVYFITVEDKNETVLSSRFIKK